MNQEERKAYEATTDDLEAILGAGFILAADEFEKAKKADESEDVK